MPKAAPLSVLPLSSIVRSLAITSISSSPLLLGPSLAIMSKLAHSQSPILSPDTNPLLRYFLKRTFYRQFCAGENAMEVKHTVDSLKAIGFKGVILGYAKEVVMDETQTASLSSCSDTNAETAEACIRNEIIPWANGTLETVKMTAPGDFVALKFTGAGSQALFDLTNKRDPSPALREAIDSVCNLAAERGVRLLFDAEQQAVQAGIDAWTLEYMRKFNKTAPGKAVIYGTYQAYLKATPSVLASHLAAARQDGFTLGVKLVRGAYLGSDPRHLIHETKAQTDTAYNGIAESLALRCYNSILKPAESDKNAEFPEVNVVLAGHNHTSVRRIQALRTTQAQKGEPQTELVYAQLQGMADEVSCELVQAGQVEGEEVGKVDVPKAYKYLVWGTTGECMKYLLRRAQENRDAVERTLEGRNAMAAELWRRVRKVVGA
ncbi:FAD-linked oxidoreductase [Hyaloscypha variabilis F]|uniref:Proline dehydrogenase n=1 Tax=Hyaloscypha variabilis (strain UAMH 11265 / GT02V1 / F) TaxID=1149755 RepID=A0A2J6RIQ3_HYAVF|nr:FAD-linked oxidoreductase [Hyaloscypha variabilis F]